jgi:hypothetical protein
MLHSVTFSRFFLLIGWGVIRLRRLGAFGDSYPDLVLADVSFLTDLVVRFGHLLARVVRFDWFHAPLWPLPCGRGSVF